MRCGKVHRRSYQYLYFFKMEKGGILSKDVIKLGGEYATVHSISLFCVFSIFNNKK